MEQNELYPIFLKVAELEVLIVGGGNVGLEKLSFLLKSSPNAKVTIVSLSFLPELIALAKNHNAEIIEAAYHNSFLEGKYMVIATTDVIEVNIQVYKDCRQRNILVNVADNPPYCDFYMGGIVTKGNIKIAISTNGKSPTLAKRLRQFLEEIIPENIDELAENLNSYRKTIKGDFQKKVTTLNNLTKGIINKK
ncbi:MAG: siroheme synthase [Bacteroidetes bacterium HGW-Bacteroidetes-18]|nr:MAG: siroheme synthase [Bacteroidetes bacterium HGW-Bacteroidetes-18]